MHEHTTISAARERLAYGIGTVEKRGVQIVARSARQADGRRAVLGRFRFDPADPPSEERARADAEKMLRDVAELAAQAGLGDGDAMTIRAYGPRFLDERELSGRARAMKGRDAPTTIKSDRGRWRLHIATAAFSARPAETVESAEIREWLAKLGKKKTQDVRAHDPKKRRKSYRRKARPLSPQSIRHAFNLLSKAFDAMKRDGHVTHNPCDGVERPKVAEGEFSYLDAEEQERISGCDWRPSRAGERAELRGEADKLRAMFAWGTGLRQYDQWSLKLADVRGLGTTDPHLYYYNHKKREMVRTPLFGVALRVAERQLEILATYCPKNEHHLFFPLPSGARRQRGKDYGWHKLCDAAGVTKWVTWHELRDTCATSLLNGWWGRRWRLEEVRDMLAHSGIEVTERYAHMATGTLDKAGRKTPGLGKIGHGIGHGSVSGVSSKSKSSAIPRRATSDSDRRPSAPEAFHEPIDLHGLSPLRGQFVANLARTVLSAGAAGDRSFARLATELAEAVLAQATDNDTAQAG
jgi:site-specific recombinase XerD